MEKNFIEDKIFNDIDYSTVNLPAGEYEQCIFTSCNFADIDLSGISFSECSFNDCNLSTAKLSTTALKDVKFTGCKMLGLHFNDCNNFIFEVYFSNCILNLSSFYKMKMKKTIFKDCTMQEVDFAETDLTAAVIDNCDLLNTVFDNTILEKADLRTAYNYSINPEINRIKKAKFSTAGIAGLLDKYDIVVE